MTPATRGSLTMNGTMGRNNLLTQTTFLQTLRVNCSLSDPSLSVSHCVHVTAAALTAETNENHSNRNRASFPSVDAAGSLNASVCMDGYHVAALVSERAAS